MQYARAPVDELSPGGRRTGVRDGVIVRTDALMWLSTVLIAPTSAPRDDRGHPSVDLETRRTLVTLRVVSWSIDARSDGLRVRIGRLASLRADILLLCAVPHGAAPLRSDVSRMAWAERSVLHPEPIDGPGARLRTAILASDRAS